MYLYTITYVQWVHAHIYVYIHRRKVRLGDPGVPGVGSWDGHAQNAALPSAQGNHCLLLKIFANIKSSA